MLGWVAFVDFWVCWFVLGRVVLSCVGLGCFRSRYILLRWVLLGSVALGC